MKKIIIIFIALLSGNVLFCQVSGNINYQNQIRFPDKNIDLIVPSNTELYLSIKGMANVKADSYVAIFNVTQSGKTTEEVNDLIDSRISKAVEKIKVKEGIEILIDMISFVPVYEYEVEKKIFSKKTYNEIPAGFEIKKNIHIKFKDPNELNIIMSSLSNSEIYDLVRVDYFSENLEEIKKELISKAKIALNEKTEMYQELMGYDLKSSEKILVDGFKVVLPIEMYRSYQAYNNSSLNLKKSANINQNEKSTTLYYQPIIDKEFDFVINPTIFEPVIQVMYEIKLKVKIEKKKQDKTEKEQEIKRETKYVLVTPNGDLKELTTNN